MNGDYLCSTCGAFGENGEYITDSNGEEFCFDCAIPAHATPPAPPTEENIA